MAPELPDNISISNKNNLCWIKMSGEADVEFVNAFSKTAAELESQEATIPLVVDLKEVTYIDSASLGIFVKLIKVFQRKKQIVIIFQPRSAIEELFHLTGLSRFVSICHTDAELEQVLARKKKRKKALAETQRNA